MQLWPRSLETNRAGLGVGTMFVEIADGEQTANSHMRVCRCRPRSVGISNEVTATMVTVADSHTSRQEEGVPLE